MARTRDIGVRLDGRGYAERLVSRLRERVDRVEGSVGIATLLVGDDEASAIYQRRIDRGARLLGIASRPERLPADATFGQVVGKLAELDVDPEISGILVLRPLPRHLPEARILRAIPPHKDVEAQHPENAGLLALGTPRFVPSTPAAAFVMLDSYMLDTGREIETAYDGLDLVVVGRSSNDIGINPVTAPDGRVHLVGDVDFDSAIEVAEAVSPVPGGVGPITDAWVLHNAILGAERSTGAGRQADSTHLVETLGRFAAPILGSD
jgi:5,10-methylene-tetrahydrofolate dehydrogenase/methenyl tetrahydrofolate cyclohydrolase